ncbi:hypothetical protein DOS84_09855 [Flavobacterium aquariorum]|uniref:Uncharacterized protein n=1 Tax=Flavobacterium aquariorum TaxID=2217670 RepID=A0A2W7U8P8_9FLAO|nr:hypothetical protein [Flavobacterium aquariorum]PZX93699.1 hypothetical protein DOS84_09855 [Flavobacterium aquariorum]
MKNLVNKYNADLVAKSDMSIEMAKKHGSIPYLATVSHSLSHTQYWLKVDEVLKSAFSSGKNTGYKPK